MQGAMEDYTAGLVMQFVYLWKMLQIGV